MKKIVYIILIILTIYGKYYDTNKKNEIKNEVINEIENEKRLDLYYNEFNDTYIIKVNGDIYEKEYNDIIIINEYEDFKTYEDIINK